MPIVVLYIIASAYNYNYLLMDQDPKSKQIPNSHKIPPAHDNNARGSHPAAT